MTPLSTFHSPYVHVSVADSAHQPALGVSEVPDSQIATAATSNFAIFFTFSVASAVLYIALTYVVPHHVSWLHSIAPCIAVIVSGFFSACVFDIYKHLVQAGSIIRWCSVLDLRGAALVSA